MGVHTSVHLSITKSRREQWSKPGSTNFGTRACWPVFSFKPCTLGSSYSIILQTATDWVNFSIANTLEVACDLLIGLFIFALINSTSQSPARFANGKRYGKHYYFHQIWFRIQAFELAYLHLTLASSNGQGHVYFDNEYLWNGDR